MQQDRKKYFLLKCLTLILVLCVGSFSCRAQLLKRIGDGLKSNAEQKAINKVNEKINKGLDSLVKSHSKKKDAPKDNNAANADKTDGTSANTDSTNTYNDPPTNENEPATGDAQAPQDGFISMNTSASTTFPGGSIVISGESVLYGKYTSVALIIKGPYTEDADPKPVSGFTKQTKKIPMDKDGKYITTWNVGGTDGAGTGAKPPHLLRAAARQ